MTGTFFTFFASLGVMLLYGLSAFGWGSLIGRFCYGARVPGWAYSTALGLAVWILLGGVLNDLRLVCAWALDTLAGLGLLAAAGFLWDALRNRSGNIATRVPDPDDSGLWRGAHWPAWGFLLLAAGFLVVTVMPTLVFNPYDDLNVYFARPVRMLQTGTVGGNSFDILGLDSLGAQAFLHAAVVAHFSHEFINGVDAIFCFAISGCLLIELARRLDSGGIIAGLAVLALIAIHPQIVNVSAVYSGTLMALAVIPASLLLLEPDSPGRPWLMLRKVIPPALLTAALLALKTTFVFFAVAYWMLFFGILIFAQPHRMRSLATAGLLFLGCATLVAPWAALHVPHYQSALERLATVGIGTDTVLPGGDGIMALFSDTRIWAGSPLHYDLIAVFLAAAFAAALWTVFTRDAARWPAVSVATAALAGASAGTFLFNGHLFDVETALRYSAPVLIAALPAAAILLTRAVPPAGAARNITLTTIAAALITVVALFSGPLLQRAGAAAGGHTLVSFPVPASYHDYMRGALGAPARDGVRQAQLAIAEGATLLAWISVPFHLDHSRNPILAISEPGLANPWVHLPIGAGQDVLKEYLRSIGVRYVFLEYRGAGINPDSTLRSYVSSPYPHYRRVGQANLYLRGALLALAEESRIIMRAPGKVLYEVAQARP